MMNIVILDGYASNPGDLNWDLLEQLGNVTVYPRTTDEEKIERAKDADIILINKVQIDSETLDQLPKLKYIGIQATGYNVVDIEAVRKQELEINKDNRNDFYKLIDGRYRTHTAAKILNRIEYVKNLYLECQ